MISRTTNSAASAAAQQNLTAAMQRLATVQNKAATLKEIAKPSDNPAAAAEAMAVRGLQRSADQHSRNIDNAQGWLTTADSALTSTTGLLQRIRDLTVAGANDGSLSPVAKEAVAVELDGLAEELLKTANTTYMGRHVFAGTTDAPAAFDQAGVHAGVPGSAVERRVGPGTTVRVDVDGAAAFGSGAGSVFALVANIATDLRAGVNVSARIEEIDDSLQRVLGAQAVVGATHSSVNRAADLLAENSVSLEARRSSLEDADLAMVALDLQTQELAYQAALAASAKVLQPSLMDYLR